MRANSNDDSDNNGMAQPRRLGKHSTGHGRQDGAEAAMGDRATVPEWQRQYGAEVAVDNRATILGWLWTTRARARRMPTDATTRRSGGLRRAITRRQSRKAERHRAPEGKSRVPRWLWATEGYGQGGRRCGGLIAKMTPLDAGVVLAVRITCGVTDGRKASGLVGVVPAADKGRF